MSPFEMPSSFATRSCALSLLCGRKATRTYVRPTTRPRDKIIGQKEMPRREEFFVCNWRAWRD
eukprot:scaffold335420_cov31-Attheya_sp.AAC.1